MGEPKDHTVYVQLVVKACPQAETPLEPINQGKIYDNEAPLTLEQRKAALVTLGCIDVPVPMDFLADAMSPSACMGHGGYLAATQFLEQRQDLASCLPSAPGSASLPTTRSSAPSRCNRQRPRAGASRPSRLSGG